MGCLRSAARGACARCICAAAGRAFRAGGTRLLGLTPAAAAAAQWSHIACGALCGINLLTAANLRGGLSASQWAAALLPFSGGGALTPHVAARKPAGSCAADAVTAAAGLACSVALAAAASAQAERAAEGGGVAMLRVAAAAGAWICALGALASDGADVAQLLLRGGRLQVRSVAARPLPRGSRAPSLTRRRLSLLWFTPWPQVFRCGNFGVLLAAAAAGCTDAVAILEARPCCDAAARALPTCASPRA